MNTMASYEDSKVWVACCITTMIVAVGISLLSRLLDVFWHVKFVPETQTQISTAKRHCLGDDVGPPSPCCCPPANGSMDRGRLFFRSVSSSSSSDMSSTALSADTAAMLS